MSYTIRERARRKSEVHAHIQHHPGESLATLPHFLSMQATLGGVNADTVLTYITELLAEKLIEVRDGRIYPAEARP